MTSIRDYLDAAEGECAPLSVDEYLSALEDLPEPDECPYCAERIQVVETVQRWQRVIIERDDNGDLEVTDYGSQETSDDGTGEFYECTSATHEFSDLYELDAEQREQHALALLTDDPGARG